MLSKNQIEVLKYLVENNEEYIIDSAQYNGISNPDASVGVAKFLVANTENFSRMEPKQSYHYEKTIKPLIINVRCEGMIDEEESCFTSGGDGSIDEDSLLRAYITQDMRCQHCVYQKESWFANNS